MFKVTPKPSMLKPADVEKAYAAAQRVVEVHRRLAKFLRPGMNTAQIDAWVAKTLDELGCRSCFLNYRVPRHPPFPSHACLSVNSCVVHGTATSHPRPLQNGDLLKVDIGVWHQGWVGDAGWTYHIGEPTPAMRRLMDSGKESLARGVKEIRPDRTWIAWARTVQQHVEERCGFHLVRGLGGHGLYDPDKGKPTLHGPPFVSNVVPSAPGEWPDAHKPCLPGTIVAVEPMIGVTTGKVTSKGNEWPVYIADGSMSVHYEHDVLVTETGNRILTEGIEDTPDVIL
jgi:methionyl aminopeptidase